MYGVYIISMYYKRLLQLVQHIYYIMSIRNGKVEEEHKYKYGWIHGEGEIFFYYHYLYKSVNVGIIIYRSRKKWHELCSSLQRLGKIVCIYKHICVLHDVHFTYV